MSIRDNIREMMQREPFQSLRLVTSIGESYVVHNPGLMVLMGSEVFIAQPNSDKHTFVPVLHISAVESLGNGRGRERRRLKSK